MRYSFLCIVVLNFICLFTLNSQISVGASAGITFSNLYEIALNSGTQYHQLNGFKVNTVTNYRLNTMFSVQSELGYMRINGKVRGLENIVNNIHDIGFLTLMPCLNINFGKFTSYAGVGLSINYVIDTNGFSEATSGRPFWLPSDSFLQTEFNRVNFGVNYTGGILYSSTKYSVFLQFIYADIEDSFAKIDIVSNNVNVEPTRFVTYSIERILSLNLGFMLPLKGEK